MSLAMAIAYAGLSFGGLIVVGVLITILWPYRTLPDNHPPTRPLPPVGAAARARVVPRRPRSPLTPNPPRGRHRPENIQPR